MALAANGGCGQVERAGGSESGVVAVARWLMLWACWLGQARATPSCLFSGRYAFWITKFGFSMLHFSHVKDICLPSPREVLKSLVIGRLFSIFEKKTRSLVSDLDATAAQQAEPNQNEAKIHPDVKE